MVFGILLEHIFYLNTENNLEKNINPISYFLILCDFKKDIKVVVKRKCEALLTNI